ncbi:membrane progestin receptor gamma-A isoform X2 [Paramormyrops kingsleyae]|uniref:Progestin and adipoQ receptor family member Va n=1 Tax=Paramormyrops kingsleyae TaxID=1676925 RepID=A0A3B3TAC2_9TELE|nr:membrane progestin receptor gamma isoform X2 [Paramormyrops kingsleyae]
MVHLEPLRGPGLAGALPCSLLRRKHVCLSLGVCLAQSTGDPTGTMLNLIKFPPIFTVHQVPTVFQEDSIISGYRHPRSSATDCVLSLFQLTNETLNIWTHFLPTWYFLWKLLMVALMQNGLRDAYSWPLLVFLASCCLYPLTSSCAHTFSSMSTRARHICFFFDYGALSFYSLGSAVTYSAYVFPDRWVGGVFHQYYVSVAVFNTVICTALACYSRFTELQSPTLGKAVRVLAFAYPYLFDNIPLFYRISVCIGDDCTNNETNGLHYCHITLAFLTVFLFITHLPERLAPGRFDYIGHSHQLFHMCGIIGTYVQMEAILLDMSLRQPWLQVHGLPTSFNNSFGALLLSLTLSLLIIFSFSQALFWMPSKSCPTAIRDCSKPSPHQD